MRAKSLKIFLGVLCGIILLTLIFAPTLIRSYLVKNSTELIGRKVALEKLQYNYFTSTVRAFDFILYEANETDTFVSFDTLLVDLQPLKLFQSEVSLEQVYVSGLMGKVIMDGSSFNFDDLLDFFASSDSSTVEEDGEEFKYEISNIEFRDLDFIFYDKEIGKQTKITEAEIFIPYIAWDQNTKSQGDLAFDLSRGGHFSSNFNFDPKTGDYSAEFEIKQLFLDPFYEYIKEYAAINSLEGKVDASVILNGNAFEFDQSKVALDLVAYDFSMTDTTDREFLGAKEARFVASEIDYYNSTYTIEKIEVIESYTFFQLDSSSNNFFRIFYLDEENEPLDSSDSVESTPIQYRIGELKLESGRLDYTDNLTGKPFNYQLSEIQLDSKDILSEAAWLDIQSTMLLNGRGNLTASLGLNSGNFENLTLDISVEKFLLPDLNIYTNYYMGHSVLSGDMYYYSKSKIVDGQITSENRLLVKDAALETTDAGLYSLPLKFAFFLLTDRNGDVDLDIPVRGDLNDPTLKLSTIIWDTFKNVIDKVVLAPVDFLVGLVGGDPKELEEITFAYTDTIPGNKEFRQLSKLVELEQKKDGLSIVLNYYVDEDLQMEALSKHLLGSEFNSDKRDYNKNEKEFEAFIYEKIGSDSLPLNKAISILTKDQNIDSIRMVWTEILLEKVQLHLKEEKPNTQIKIIRGEPNAPENVGAYPFFKITYDMLSTDQKASPTIDPNR